MNILVYGDFNYSGGPFDGATTKTRNIFNVVKDKYSFVDCFNLEGWRQNPIKKFFELCLKLKKSDAVIFVPGAKNGTFFALKYLTLLKKKNTKLYYFLAGSLLPRYLDEKPKYTKYVKKMDGVFCETNGLIGELKDKGIHNVYLSPTFDLRGNYAFYPKDLSSQGEYHFCSFCRVTKVKGIALACEAVNYINNLKKQKCKIYYDIYGKLDAKFERELNELIEKSDGMIRYCGIIEEKSVIETLRNYDANIFASFFDGECLPATVIESLKASTPLIISDWKYNKEIITDGVEGFVFGKTKNELVSTILEKCLDCNPFSSMRINCYNKSKLYNPDNCLKDLFLLLKEQ